MDKKRNGNFAFIFSLAAVLAVVGMFKVVMDLNSQLNQQAGILTELENELALLKTGTIKAQPRVVDAPRGFDAPPEKVENPYVKPTELKMRKGYYCQTGDQDSLSVVYFDGEGKMKAWDETNGKFEYIEKNPPHWSGTYKISGTNVFLQLQKDGKGAVFTRRALVLGADDNGLVDDLDYYNNLFSSAGCPF